MSEELKPCPFCGSDDVELVEGNLRYVTCNNCCGTGPDCHSGHEATEAWNTRAEQRVRAEIGRDSERLDWLEQKFRSCTVYMNGEQMFMPGPKVRNLKGRDFREAIDKAREVG